VQARKKALIKNTPAGVLLSDSEEKSRSKKLRRFPSVKVGRKRASCFLNILFIRETSSGKRGEEKMGNGPRQSQKIDVKS